MPDIFNEIMQQTALLPTHLILWLSWMFLVSFIAPLLLMKHAVARRIVLVQLAMTLFALFLFSEAGLSRLLGLAHVLFWTPIVYYLVRQIKAMQAYPILLAWAKVCIVTMCLSLMFDYVDVVRYILGERELLVNI
ncbi:MAG: hypothetical protein OEZ58_20320 [Gammaproteobacteria bacterium]|nr:hypothetical protein [Gammaproteobacteria bacterium]MDH5731338.1 hypothetical protein [Gammaproteobacteria bacterium]